MNNPWITNCLLTLQNAKWLLIQYIKQYIIDHNYILSIDNKIITDSERTFYKKK